MMTLAEGFRYEIARCAGGLTITELRRLGDAKSLDSERYYDPGTDLWVPRGVLLFRPREKVRDLLEVK